MESYLPRMRRVRDPGRFREKIAGIPLRILVEGTRGKSSTVLLLEEQLRKLGYRTLAKVTGFDSMFIWDGKSIPIVRKSSVPLLDYDNIPGILDFDCDALVVENQAITPYTMRYIHSLFSPHHVLVPNIRIDHTEGLGDDLREMAGNFLKNYRVGDQKKNVYYAENIGEIRNVVSPLFSEFARKNPDRMTFFETRLEPTDCGIPCIETTSVVSLFMEKTFGITLDRDQALPIVLGGLALRTGPAGVRYLNLAKVNDPVSFLQVIRYVFRDTADTIGLVGYFRKDRRGRNLIFEEIFPDIEKFFGDRIQRIWFAGYGTRHAFDRLSPAYRRKAQVNTTVTDIEPMLSVSREKNLVLVTMCNRVNPFMDSLMEKLEGPATNSGQTECLTSPEGKEIHVSGH